MTEKQNTLVTLLKGKSVEEAEKLLYEALRIIKKQSIIN